MQAIQVRYLPNSCEAKATCAAGSFTIPVNDFANEAVLAAEGLQQKLGWNYILHEGVLPNGDFVFAQKARQVVSYHIFTRENYSYENPFALVVFYDQQANIYKAIEYRCLTNIHATAQRLYPTAKALYGGLITLTPSAYNDFLQLLSTVLLRDR